jgi:ankyrin repeat protein
MKTKKVLSLAFILSVILSASLPVQDILKATQKGDVKTVKAILSVNPDLAKIKDKWGRTPLHFAVDINNVEIIECLIGSGADVDAIDVYAWTPLFRAIDKGKKEAAELLINKSADINHGMEDGFKAVHLASSVGNTELLELLLQRGANQHAKDRYGLTPLHIAAAYGFNSIVELLISYKTDMNAKSIDGGSAIHFAQAGGNQEIADLIRSKEANAEPRKYPVFKGKYLGFKGPGLKPEIFLPGIIMHLNPPHNGLAISPDSKEIYWTETSINYDLYSSVWFMKEVDGIWTPPLVATLSSRHLDSYPCFSLDGKRIFFSSNRPLEEKMEPKDSNIWYVEKTKEGWSQPKGIGSSVNTDKDENMPTIDKDGTLYFSRSEVVEGKFDINIYRSRFLNGQYVESEKLEETVNSPTIDVYPFIAPDGSYLIYNTSRYGIGFQLCISFLKKDGSWTEAKPMKKLLGPFISWCQGISPDGQYLFFAGHKNGVWDIYWVDAKIIEELKPEELK